MSNPMPTIDPYGAADWNDYDHNWRALDADWLQSRSILRYQTSAQRDAAPSAGGLGGAPAVGTFIYNATEDALEFRSKDNTWKPYRSLPVNTKTVTDTNLLVKLAHTGSGDKGVTMSPTGVSIDLPFTVLGGALTSDTTGLSIKTGALTTAKLTTDATHLLSDKPLSVPAIKLTGTNPVIDATGKNAILATLDATTVNATTIAATGTLTGASGSINGVLFNANWVSAATGYVSQAGYFNGDANTAYVRYRNTSTGATGTSSVQVDSGNVHITGGVIDLWGTTRLRGNVEIHWYNAAVTFLGYTGPVVYSTAGLSAANYPNGTIWVS